MTTPQARPLTAAVDTLGVQVDRDTVLQARNVILDEALKLRRAITASPASRGIGPCGRDPVSADASGAFDKRIDALIGNCLRYVEVLEGSAAGLAETARRYGFTEDEITASLTSR